MTDKPNYPDHLFLPPEAFDGFSKYLNIYGANHVCDGDDYVEFVRADVSCASQIEFMATTSIGLESTYLNLLVHKALTASIKAQVKFPRPNYTTLKVAEEAGEVVRAAVHYAEGRGEWSEVEAEAVQTIAMLFRLLTEGDEINGVLPPHLKGLEK